MDPDPTIPIPESFHLEINLAIICHRFDVPILNTGSETTF